MTFLLSLHQNGEMIDPTTWQRISFGGRNHGLLKVRKFGKNELGRYTCKGINGYGSKSFTFAASLLKSSRCKKKQVLIPKAKNHLDLFSAEAQLVEDTLEDKVVRIGTSVTFTCIVRNPEEVHVKWIKRSNVNLNSNGLQLDEGLPYGVRLCSETLFASCLEI